MFLQGNYEFVPMVNERENPLAQWWDLVERFAQNDSHEWRSLSPTYQLHIVGELKADLYGVKRKIEERQSLARLYFLPSFLNHSTDFNVHNEDERELRESAYLVYKRYPALLHASILIECSKNDPLFSQVRQMKLSIIADSAVKEWPVEMEKDGQLFHWDRMPLVFKKSSESPSNRRLSTIYQIRFLALVYSKDGERLSFRRYIHKAKAYFILEMIGKDQNIFIGKQQKREKPVGQIHTKDPNIKPKPAKKGKKDELTTLYDEIIIHEERLDGVKAIMLECTNDMTTSSLKLWKQTGNLDDYKHFTITLDFSGVYSSEGAGINKYQFYTEIELQTSIGNIYMGDNPRPTSHYPCPGLISLPFELTTNPSTHADGHFFPFTWSILNTYYNLNPTTKVGETKGLTWSQLEPWFSGLIAANCEHFCRRLDSSELRSFRRMLLLNRVMKTAGVGRVEHRNASPEQWGTQTQERLQNLEMQIFGVVFTTPIENLAFESYLRAISRLLRQADLDENFLITEEDLNQKCWYVNRELSRYIRVNFEPIMWLHNAAVIIADLSTSLHSDPKFTVKMFNEGYISLRPADSAKSITELVTEKMRTFEPCKDKIPPEPTLTLRIDEFELKTICVEFSGLREKIEDPLKKNVTDPTFGRIAVDVLKNKCFYIKNTRAGVIVDNANWNQTIWGLKAFFMHGFPSKFKKIMRVIGDSDRGMKMFIFPIGKDDVESLYAVREEVEEFEEKEVNPFIGPYDSSIEQLNELLETMSFHKSSILRNIVREKQIQELKRSTQSPFYEWAYSPAIHCPNNEMRQPANVVQQLNIFNAAPGDYQRPQVVNEPRATSMTSAGLPRQSFGKENPIQQMQHPQPIHYIQPHPFMYQSHYPSSSMCANNGFPMPPYTIQSVPVQLMPMQQMFHQQQAFSETLQHQQQPQNQQGVANPGFVDFPDNQEFLHDANEIAEVLLRTEPNSRKRNEPHREPKNYED